MVYVYDVMIKKALDSLKEGIFVLVYDGDGREEETDFVIASQFVTPESIRRMRKEGGGLICTTVYYPIAKKLGLPFLSTLYEKASKNYPVFQKLVPDKFPYDAKSSFSVTINHRNNYTGITDIDRALTASEFGKFVAYLQWNNVGNEKAQEMFGKNFRAPGHIHLLNTSSRLLENRKGHTELATALMIMAGLAPSATICEMMSDEGTAKRKEDVMEYAKKSGLIFLKGEEIIEAWRIWEKKLE